MRARFVVAVILSVGMAGCSGGCAGASEVAEGPSGERTSASGGSERGATGGGTTESASRPNVRVIATPRRHGREVELQIENRGLENAQVRRRLALERRDGSSWARAGELVMRDGCEGAAPDAAECVTLAPGAVFVPPVWLGRVGGQAQCACEGCAEAPAGEYRVVAESCAGGHRLESGSLVLE